MAAIRCVKLTSAYTRPRTVTMQGPTALCSNLSVANRRMESRGPACATGSQGGPESGAGPGPLPLRSMPCGLEDVLGVDALVRAGRGAVHLN